VSGVKAGLAWRGGAGHLSVVIRGS